MVNWFYVVGSERVGPVSEAMLRGLRENGEISGETYVWKKGFAGWERMKDVTELNAPAQNEESAPAQAEEKKESSPEVQFNFDWKKVRENEELFYVRIGRDRKNYNGTDIFGPYSLVELREALSDRRINGNTLIFAPGMEGWTKIGCTPAEAGLHGTGVEDEILLNEVPLLLVMNHSPLPLITVIKKSGVKEVSALGSGPFKDYQGQAILASLYAGNEIKARNVKLRINNYDTKEQLIECDVLDMDSNARNCMLGHAV